MNYIGWLIVFVVFAALELISLGMTCIWFAIGALAACVTSLFTGNWIIQAIVFIVVTVIVLLVLRPIAVKYIKTKPRGLMWNQWKERPEKLFLK